MKSRILILLLVCALILGLTSCKVVINTGNDPSSQSSSEQASQTDSSTSDNTSTETGSEPTEASEPVPSNTDVDTSSVVSVDTGSSNDDGVWKPTVIHRQQIFDAGCMCGIAYIGYVKYDANDLDKNRRYINSVLQGMGYWDDFEFLHDLPSDRYVGTLDGTELYLVIPLDDKAKVNVNHISYDSEGESNVDSILYTFDDGAPFLLKCNASDFLSDTQILILDSNGEKLLYTPRMSLMDGSLVTEAEDGKKVWDFTIRG